MSDLFKDCILFLVIFCIGMFTGLQARTIHEIKERDVILGNLIEVDKHAFRCRDIHEGRSKPAQDVVKYFKGEGDDER